MDQKNILFIVVLTLVSAVRSDDVIKCYVCDSLTDAGCKNDLKGSKLEPVECSVKAMQNLQTSIQRSNLMAPIGSLFDFDLPQHYQGQGVPKQMACMKMEFKVLHQDVTVRSCQIAKTETIDPCKAMKSKLVTNANSMGSLEYCGLCEHDACNGSSKISPTMFYAVFSIIISYILGSGIFHRA